MSPPLEVTKCQEVCCRELKNVVTIPYLEDTIFRLLLASKLLALKFFLLPLLLCSLSHGDSNRGFTFKTEHPLVIYLKHFEQLGVLKFFFDGD